ncbi:hypothetical protein [Streptosporangium sp. G12]
MDLPVVAMTMAVPAPTVIAGGAVTVNLPAVALALTVPAPTVQASQTVQLPTVAMVWDVPDPVVSVPINPGDDLTGPGQLSLNGFRLGSGTPYRLEELIGADIDLPAVDVGNVLNPSSHGAMSGRKLSQPRIITASFKVRSPRAQMREVMETFRDNTPIAEADEELDFAMQILDEIYVARGAVTRRTAPINKNYRLGHAKAVLQVECSDPRLYKRQLNSATIADGSTVQVWHAGNTSTKPLIRCEGPAVGPLLEIARTLADGTEDVKVVEFDIEIEAGQTLIIDVKRESAEVDGVSQMRYLTGASIGVPDFVLGRGASSITYETTTGDAPAAVVLWSHAYL